MQKSRLLQILIFLFIGGLFLSFTQSAHATVLWMSGAETGSISEAVTLYGTPNISTSTVRSGTYSYETNGSNTCFYSNAAYTSTTSMYTRAYMYFTALPSVSNVIIQTVAGSTGVSTLELNTDGSLTAKIGASSGTVVGTSSTTLSPNTWYRIDFKTIVSSTVGVIEVRVNDSVVITGSNLNTGTSAITAAVYGPRLTTQDIFWDDIIENDSGYVPDGKIIARQPIVGTPTYDSWTKTGTAPYWADTPANTANSATSVSGTDAQTELIGSFSTTQSGHGTETIGSGDTINDMVVTYDQKVGTGKSGSDYMRQRVGGTDTDTLVSLSTSDAYYQGPITTPTLTNLNSMEAGGNFSGTGALYTIEDLWVMVDYAPGSGAPLDHYLVTVASPQTAGVCSTGTNTVTAQDSNNNTLTGDASTVNMTYTGTGVTFYTNSSCSTSTTQYTLSSGVANIYYEVSSGVQYITITATKNLSTETGTSNSIIINLASNITPETSLKGGMQIRGGTTIK